MKICCIHCILSFTCILCLIQVYIYIIHITYVSSLYIHITSYYICALSWSIRILWVQPKDCNSALGSTIPPSNSHKWRLIGIIRDPLRRIKIRIWILVVTGIWVRAGRSHPTSCASSPFSALIFSNTLSTCQARRCHSMIYCSWLKLRPSPSTENGLPFHLSVSGTVF